MEVNRKNCLLVRRTLEKGGKESDKYVFFFFKEMIVLGQGFIRFRATFKSMKIDRNILCQIYERIASHNYNNKEII